MSQEASTHRIISEPSEDFITTQPWTMETYADGLMDEIFSDIDQILDGSGKLPSQPAQPDFIALQSITVPEIVLPETVIQQQPPMQPLATVKGSPLSTVVVGATAIVKEPPRQKSNWFGKFLLGGTIISVAAIALILWLLNQGVMNRQVAPAPAPVVPQPQLPTKAEVETELSEYILRSLNTIEQQQAEKNQKNTKTASNTQTTAAAPATTASLPQPPVATTQAAAPARVLERIYIPVYQPPPPIRYAPPPLPVVPPRVQRPAQTPSNVRPAAKKPTAARPAPKPGTPRTATKPAPVRIATNSVRVSSAPPPVRTPAQPRPAQKPRPAVAPAPAVQPAPPPPPVVVQEPAPAPPPAAPTGSYTLEGVLDLGDASRDIALFKVDGVTRQVRGGESIGSNGWTLIEVTKDEAIIRRNGEVRSIYPGQKF